MKTLKTIFASIILVTLFSVSVMAQSGTKVIAVVNKADWCPTCEKNGERAMATLMEHNKDKAVRFIMNDLTNEESKAESVKRLQNVSLEQVMSSFKATGMVYFFNAESKELIHQVSVAKSDQELALAMDDVIKAD